jgi:hypothetical protein
LIILCFQSYTDVIASKWGAGGRRFKSEVQGQIFAPAISAFPISLWVMHKCREHCDPHGCGELEQRRTQLPRCAGAASRPDQFLFEKNKVDDKGTHRLEAPLVSIGGAGTFDRIFVIGIITVLLA